MAVQDLTKLVAHALKDDQFRQQLIANPEEAIQSAGFQLSEEELEAVKNVDLGLSEEELEERVSKMWGAPSTIGSAIMPNNMMDSAGLKTVSAFR
ncbi:hypothetical protein FE783_21775 [Paenibacillus mesophilus]|uniref:Franean1_4349 family RiPP n=1 Tax=Paenibacillus mesophilus TaxID=2582849 RepID=UPI00110DAF39|nr:Franean1_4349 family RiPP [Paenibacillus mesophilus]TMV47622.1 hypothetical protein FE783_21775 [Paenibacillus mesophilus]